MLEITLQIESDQEILKLFDKNFNTFFIHKFNPNESIEWWKTTFKIKSGEVLNDISVRGMELDIQTDWQGLKQILALNARFQSIYQFDKPVPNTLVFDYLPEDQRNVILKQNGLKHYFIIEYEFITIGSFDIAFIESIEKNPLFQNQIIKPEE
jgi:hypothetical protein